jgi:Holliday junction resolvase RusA-like endonuclease
LTQRLVIPGRLPGLNEIIAGAKHHWASYAKEKKNLTHRVGVLARAAALRTISSRCAVRFSWFESDRRRDLDNICVGQKFILDGLVSAGILPDDGWKWISGLEHRFHLDKKDPHVLVELMEEPA